MHKLLRAGLLISLMLPLVGAVSCGVAENMSPPKISTGTALGDKLINAIRVQLKVRLFLTEDVIASYLKQAVATGESLSFDSLDFRASLSADAKVYARIVFGLIREIDKLNSAYSFANAGIDEKSKKLRSSLLNLALAYTRGFTNADYANAVKRAELGFVTAYAAVAGFSASGLTDELKEAGLKEIEESVFSAIAAAKWSSSESASIYTDVGTGFLIGLRGNEFTKDLRIILASEFSESSAKKINDLDKDIVSTSAKINSVVAKTSLYLGLLKSAGFTGQELPDAADAVLVTTIPLLYKISEEKFTESTVLFATKLVDVTSPFLISVEAEEAKLFYKKVSYRLIKDYKTKAKTLPDGFVDQIQTTMTSRINVSNFDETKKAAALAGTAEGVTEIQTELNPLAGPSAETIF